MKREGKIIWQDSLPGHERSLLQPLSVAIVCAVFVGLILLMGIMDIRRSDRTLTGFMQNQGLTTIGVMRKLAEENLKNLIKASQRENAPTFTPLEEESLSPQNWLTSALAVIGRDVDEKWQAKQVSDPYLNEIASRENLWLIAVLDEGGKIVFQSHPARPSPGGDDPAPTASALSSGTDLITSLKEQNINFVALRRNDGKGTVVIALAKDALRYWAMRVSVEKALEKLGEGRELVYLVIMDREGRILGKAGDVPRSWKKLDEAFYTVLSGRKKVETRKTFYEDRKILDVTAPFQLSDRAGGVARIGLKRDSAEKILTENRRNLFVSLLFLPSWWPCSPCGSSITIRIGTWRGSSQSSGAWKRRSGFPPWGSSPRGWPMRSAIPSTPSAWPASGSSGSSCPRIPKRRRNSPTWPGSSGMKSGG